jgi:two-component system sensor histidine kinase KdpD
VRFAASPAARIAGSLGAVLFAGAAARLASANPTTAAFACLVAVLFAATWGGLAAGIVASVAAAASLTFFLPPLDSIHVADAENWVALFGFLITAVLASRLVTRARTQAERAERRAREVGELQAMTVEMLGESGALEALAGRAARALISTGARGAGLLRRERGETVLVEWRGEPCPGWALELGGRPDAAPRTIAVEGHAERDFFLPLQVGGALEGVFVALATRADAAAVESVVRVLSLALERARLQREQAHLEALRESEALKTAILRAVSHDLSTPLTAIGFQIDAIRRRTEGLPVAANVVELEREVSRLRRRIDELLALSRIEAGVVRPHPEPVPPADLFRAVRESLATLPRPIRVRIDAECPELFADPSLALEILVNLLENADRASAEGVPIDLVADAAGDGVRLGVLDRGHGLAPPREAGEIAPGDASPAGLGLEIARRFAAASGGSISLESRPEGGVAAWVLLPAAPVAERV